MSDPSWTNSFCVNTVYIVSEILKEIEKFLIFKNFLGHALWHTGFFLTRIEPCIGNAES